MLRGSKDLFGGSKDMFRGSRDLFRGGYLSRFSGFDYFIQLTDYFLGHGIYCENEGFC
jgi:hypothetical protein